MSQSGFVVDTHLLRELGDLLVGRDSTAILELVKNGYDADATLVRIDAQGLATPEEAVLIVEDDGHGMTAERFRSAFLRIAGRHKEEGERVSPKYRRAYTGQKGIGRLASQKLARVLEVGSVPDVDVAGSEGPGVEARIEWDVIDQQDDLHKLNAGLVVTDVPVVRGMTPGTMLSLRSLKRTWTSADIGKFVSELHSAQPPRLLLGSKSEELAISGNSLFGRPVVREAGSTDPGFTLELAGELAPGDDLWVKAADDFHWCVEIDVSGGRTRYLLTPTVALVTEEPLARAYSFEADADPSLRFQARFYMMPNASATRGPLKGFVRASSGIRVYLEGFRVLPYAEYGDDWLEIDREYRSGPRYYTIDVDAAASDDVEVDTREALNAVASNAYFGAVFLTVSGAPGLESLVNREGFVPGPTFTTIRQIVQDGVRLCVRVRRSIHNQRAKLNALDTPTPESPTPDTRTPDHDESGDRGKGAPTQDPSPGPGGTPTFDPTGRTPFEVLAAHGSTIEDEKRIAAAVEAAAKIVASGETGEGSPGGSRPIDDLVDGFNAARIALHAVQSFQPELRVLAGVGLQLGAFVHEINGMLAASGTIRELLRAVLDNVADPKQRNTLQVALRSADELAHTLARQSSYLTDVLSADPRRRRSRLKVKERAESVLRYLAGRLAAKEVAVHVDVAPTLRTGPMFPAELSIMLTNLLTNAVKNTKRGGNIWIDGTDHGDAVEISVSNDGVAVDLDEAERWFLPFESTTTVVDDVLGQGLGLGLPIVRALTDDYRGDVRFVPPLHGPGTSIRVLLPKKGTRK